MRKKSRNKDKGFTLIEIIVSLMIASIAMVIATTLILNSMGYFNKTAVSDNDKQVLDSIKDYVQNELMYASDVTVQANYPTIQDATGETLDTGWHYLYVKGNQLYRDNNCETDFTKAVPVYGDDFYSNGRKLFIYARTFSDYRIDFKLYLTERNGEETDLVTSNPKISNQVYKTSTTIELLNVKGGNINLSQTDLNSLTSSDENNGIKVFYKKDDLTISKPLEDLDTNGTVADELNCDPDKENVKSWAEQLRENNGKFKKGDFVKYGDVIYRATKDSTNTVTPNESNNYMWKRIYSPQWDQYSVYDKNDIVIYNNAYYICITAVSDGNNNSNPTNDDENWKKATDEEVEEAKKKHAEADYCGEEETGGKWTVGEEHLRCEQGEKIVDFEKLNASNSNPKTYVAGTFVRYNGVLYRAIKTTTNTAIPPTGSDWKVITIDWSSASGYMRNDVVRFNGSYYRMIYYAGYIDPSPHNPVIMLNNYWIGPYTLAELDEFLTENEDEQPRCTVRDGTGN